MSESSGRTLCCLNHIYPTSLVDGDFSTNKFYRGVLMNALLKWSDQAMWNPIDLASTLGGIVSTVSSCFESTDWQLLVIYAASSKAFIDG